MPKIFLDMDGVLTDFDQAVKNIGHETGLSETATEEQKTNMYAAINTAGLSFWTLMPWTPDGQTLWNILKPYHPTLLSSPGQFIYAKAGKIQWVTENIPGTTLLLSTEKWRYANWETILIDDDINNIEA
jgi:hypothetical protein